MDVADCAAPKEDAKVNIHIVTVNDPDTGEDVPRIMVTPKCRRVYGGGTMEWRALGSDFDWLVVFGGATPLENDQRFVSWSSSQPVNVADDAIDAAPYKYTVYAWIGEDPVPPLDPEVIVDPDPKRRGGHL